jgi:hypothetical protein
MIFPHFHCGNWSAPLLCVLLMVRHLELPKRWQYRKLVFWLALEEVNFPPAFLVTKWHHVIRIGQQS